MFFPHFMEFYSLSKHDFSCLIILKKNYAAASLSMKEKGQTIKGHKGLINNNKMA